MYFVLWVLFLCHLYVLCSPSASLGEGFVNVQRINDLIDLPPSTAVYSLGQSRNLMVCPTIQTNGTYLMEPMNNSQQMGLGPGIFAVNMTQEDFVLMHIIGGCKDSKGEGDQCDQLLMEYQTVPARKGELQISYSMVEAQSCLIATVIYGPPVIEYTGPTPISNLPSAGVSFTYQRDRHGSISGSDFSVCQSNSSSRSTVLTPIEGLVPNINCVLPQGLSNELNQLLLMFVTDRPSQEFVRVVEGSCPAGSDQLSSPEYEVIYDSGTTPTPNTTLTTPSTTSPSGSPSPGSPDNYIAIGAATVAAIFGCCFVGILIIIVCLLMRHYKSGNMNVSGREQIGMSVQQTPNGLAETEDVKDGADPLPQAIETNVDSPQHEEPGTGSSVDRIAVISSESPDMTRLSSVLRVCHGCERLHPVASDGSADQPSSVADLHLQICRWLQEGVLVYIIWEGSLEKLNGNNTISRIVRLFSSQNKRDKNMHQLIFLQLGGHPDDSSMKSTVLPNHSLWLFQESPGSQGFDLQSCAQQVHDAVIQRLRKENSRQLITRNTDHRAAEHTKNQATFTDTDHCAAESENRTDLTVAAAPHDQPTQAIKKIIDKAVKELKQEVVNNTEKILDAMGENQLAVGQVFESEPDPSATGTADDTARPAGDSNLNLHNNTSEAKVLAKKLK